MQTMSNNAFAFYHGYSILESLWDVCTLFEGKSKANQPSEHLKYNTVNEGDRKRRVAYQYLH